MAKIDRLGWAEGMSFNAYGVRVGMRVNDSAILTDLIARLPPGSKPALFAVVDHLYSIIGSSAKSESKVRRLSLGYWNLSRFARAREFDDMLDAFESHVQLTVAEYAPRRVFVHAGVVGWQDRAILIPGLSFSGKTTLVAELVRAGAVYYSDEYAVLDSTGRVHPYARRLSMRKADGAEGRRLPVESLGGSRGAKPLSVGLVVVTEYKSGARWRPRRLSAGQGALQLLNNTVSIQRNPQAAFPVLKQVASQARILKGPRGEAKGVVDSILRIVSE